MHKREELKSNKIWPVCGQIKRITRGCLISAISILGTVGLNKVVSVHLDAERELLIEGGFKQLTIQKFNTYQ